MELSGQLNFFVVMKKPHNLVFILKKKAIIKGVFDDNF